MMLGVLGGVGGGVGGGAVCDVGVLSKSGRVG